MNSKKLLGLGFLMMLIYIIICHTACTSKPTKTNNPTFISSMDTLMAPGDTLQIFRVKILENGTTSYVVTKQYVYHISDTVWVNLGDHTIDDTYQYSMLGVLIK